jgi:hypothetical protein
MPASKASQGWWDAWQSHECRIPCKHFLSVEKYLSFPPSNYRQQTPIIMCMCVCVCPVHVDYFGRPVTKLHSLLWDCFRLSCCLTLKGTYERVLLYTWCYETTCCSGHRTYKKNPRPIVLRSIKDCCSVRRDKVNLVAYWGGGGGGQQNNTFWTTRSGIVMRL